jgi:hypothetical protein
MSYNFDVPLTVASIVFAIFIIGIYAISAAIKNCVICYKEFLAKKDAK